MKLNVLGISALMLAATSGQVQAGFQSQTIGYQYLFADINSVYYDAGNVAVTNGVELAGLYGANTYATVDVSDTNILVDYYEAQTWTTASFNGFRIFDTLSTLSAIQSVTVNAATNLAGFSAANVTYNGDNIWVNWNGLSFDPNTIVSLDVNFGSVGAVPEPASLGMWGLGAFGIAIARRKRRQMMMAV